MDEGNIRANVLFPLLTPLFYCLLLSCFVPLHFPLPLRLSKIVYGLGDGREIGDEDLKSAFAIRGQCTLGTNSSPLHLSTFPQPFSTLRLLHKISTLYNITAALRTHSQTTSLVLLTIPFVYKKTTKMTFFLSTSLRSCAVYVCVDLREYSYLRSQFFSVSLQNGKSSPFIDLFFVRFKIISVRAWYCKDTTILIFWRYKEFV